MRKKIIFFLFSASFFYGSAEETTTLTTPFASHEDETTESSFFDWFSENKNKISSTVSTNTAPAQSMKTIYIYFLSHLLMYCLHLHSLVFEFVWRYAKTYNDNHNSKPFE